MDKEVKQRLVEANLEADRLLERATRKSSGIVAKAYSEGDRVTLKRVHALLADKGAKGRVVSILLKRVLKCDQ